MGHNVRSPVESACATRASVVEDWLCLFRLRLHLDLRAWADVVKGINRTCCDELRYLIPVIEFLSLLHIAWRRRCHVYAMCVNCKYHSDCLCVSASLT